MKRIDEKITCVELLDIVEDMKNELYSKYTINDMKGNAETKKLEVSQRNILMAAINKATTPEDLELCAISVETIYCGDDIDVDEWAEQIRIKAYGLDWYLSQYFSSTEYKELVIFTKNTKMVNPFENLK